MAELARIALDDAEISTLQGEVESILKYVDTIQKVELPERSEPSVYLDIENVMRDDTEPHAPGAFTDALLAQAPAKDGKFFKVKKILG